jgi:hypothetical protein
MPRVVFRVRQDHSQGLGGSINCLLERRKLGKMNTGVAGR